MRIIKIKSNGMGRYDDVSPFLVERGALELSVPLPDKAGDFYLVADNNGSRTTQFIPREGTVALVDLQAGELGAEIKHYLRGTLIESYKIEPLVLKAVDTTLSAMPEIAAMQAKIAKQGEEIKTLSGRLEAAEKAAYERECALLRYVWADYCTNVQINGLTLPFADFCKAIGFESKGRDCGEQPARLNI